MTGRVKLRKNIQTVRPSPMNRADKKNDTFDEPDKDVLRLVRAL